MGNQKTFRLEAGKGKIVPEHTMKISEQWNYNSIQSKLRQQLGRSTPRCFTLPHTLNRRVGRPENQ
jgi:hypothetical protein